jgi:transcriptional regulator with XRE-family HTH domain
VYLLCIYAPPSGVVIGPTGRTFARETGRPFLFHFKKLSSVFLFATKLTFIVNLMQVLFIFNTMKTKKTKRGPRKGIKHTEIKRSPFGARLFSLRKARGTSQKELGEKVGLSLRMVSYYERDTQGPPVAVLIKMANALGVTPGYLLGDKSQKIESEKTSPLLKKRFDTLKQLPPKEQKTILHMIEMASRNGTSD